MPLILVVEPGSRHAAQLAAMARKHLKAELVMAGSAGRAVAAMADRVPDVLLMSRLLSREDEATLAAWLRGLGPAAAHVQEVTIPILAATPPPVPRRRGVLSGLRRNRGGTAATDGCGLDEFARQVSAYVDLACAQRAIAEPVVERAPTCDPEAPPVLPEPEIVPIEAAPIEGIIEEDDLWVPVGLEDAWEEPAVPQRIWVLTPISGSGELHVAAPAQDEWSFFDPEQCGFAALVAKLDEITEDKDANQTSANTTGRLITC
jgi:hypothetical protein